MWRLLAVLSEKDGNWHFYRNNVPFFQVRDGAGNQMGVNLMRRWTGQKWEYVNATAADIEEGESWNYW